MGSCSSSVIVLDASADQEDKDLIDDSPVRKNAQSDWKKPADATFHRPQPEQLLTYSKQDEDRINYLASFVPRIVLAHLQQHR